MGWVEKRARGWRASVRVMGEVQPLRKAGFPTKAAAQRWVRETETDMARGQWRHPNTGAVTLEAWVAKWLRTRGTLKPSAAIAEESICRTHLVPTLGHLRLDEVTPLVISTLVSDLTTKRAPATVRNIYCVLAAVLRDAVREGLLASNPTAGTRLPVKRRTKPQVFLTEAQVGHLVSATPQRWRPLVLTLAWTGMRWGEAVGLRVGSVDILARELHVSQTLNEANGVITVGTPKTRAGYRTLPLADVVVDALLPLVSGRGSDELVFTSRGGQPVRHRNFATRVWLPSCRAAGLEPPPTPHDLRHFFASVLIAHGVDLHAVKVLMGHESIKTTSDTYGYLMPRSHDGIRAALGSASMPVLPVCSQRREGEDITPGQQPLDVD